MACRDVPGGRLRVAASHPSPASPEGRWVRDPGGSPRAAGLPAQSFGSLSSPWLEHPKSGGGGEQGPETERYQRVSAVVEGASATPGIQQEWCQPVCAVG